MIRKMPAAVVAVALVLALGACSPSVPPFTPRTISWSDDGAGFVKFYSDDPALLGHWRSCLINSPTGDSNWTYTAEIKKVSGSQKEDKGVFFQLNSQDGYISADIYDGQYYLYCYDPSAAAGKTDLYWNGSSWDDTGTFISFPITTFNTGAGAVNAISVVRTDGAPPTYAIMINGVTEVASLPVPTPTFTDGSGKFGAEFYISKTSDSLPSKPVDFRFRILSPVVVP